MHHGRVTGDFLLAEGGGHGHGMISIKNAERPIVSIALPACAAASHLCSLWVHCAQIAAPAHVNWRDLQSTQLNFAASPVDNTVCYPNHPLALIHETFAACSGLLAR
ncbi:hypothetical protein GCM10028811_12070 [Uliginosibacterium sediminicola]